MKLAKNIYIALAGVMMLSTSCASSWTEPKAEVLDNQKGLKRLYPLLEARGVEDLTPTMAKHYQQIREEYRKKDRVIGFGWFGNWSAIGDDPMGYLKMLPDSVDMVSLWGTTGRLTEAQQADLKFYQDVKGGRAMLCWIVEDTGNQITPVGKTPQDYWLKEKGGGDKVKAAEAYADAIADTIVKYNLDGFDIDLEPRYGHMSRWSDISSSRRIGDQPGDNNVLHSFIKRLYDRFKAEEEKGAKRRIIAVDGEPDLLSFETSKMIDYYILQAYWESRSQSVLNKINRLSHLDNYQRKTIITVEFEQTWRNGGTSGYRSEKYPELNNKPGAQFFDYATLDFPNGVRVAGIGSYHMEYDKLNEPYFWIRQALNRANSTIPGKFTPTN